MNLIKFTKYTFVTLIAALIFSSCSKDKTTVPDELGGYQMATTIRNNDQQINVYTANGKFQTGYNTVLIQIKNADGSLINDASVTWTPMMHMMGMSHSAPASAITKRQDATNTYSGYLVFQMASNDTEYWELSLDYTTGGKSYTAKGKIQVDAATKRVVESFTGSDSRRYVLAMAEPSAPRVAVNDMKAVLYRMESMTSFVPVDNYKIKIDPRMPGMGNHSSPNNVDLTQGPDKMYQGKLSLTMTGYWKINLQLLDAAGNTLKGENVTETNQGSSIYFELEF